MRDQTISTFLDQLAARVAAPGDGATAALHAAQSAALLAMVARYSDAARYDAKLMAHIIAETDGVRNDALTLAEADEDAFAAVAEAYRLPKDTSEQRMDRSEAIAARSSTFRSSRTLPGHGYERKRSITSPLTLVTFFPCFSEISASRCSIKNGKSSL